MYAIIETGGKQYKVAVGDLIKVEKLPVEEGGSYTFGNVLALSGDEPVFGTPFINGASVGAEVIGEGRDKKVIIYKYKSKKAFHKKRGHRQPYTQLKINAITFDKKPESRPASRSDKKIDSRVEIRADRKSKK